MVVDGSEASVSPSQVVFTPGNWNVAQQVVNAFDVFDVAFKANRRNVAMLRKLHEDGRLSPR